MQRPPKVVCQSEITLEQYALETLKVLEGFVDTPYWDVNAMRNGYGTRATEGNERITPCEAYLRMRAEYRRHVVALLRDCPECNLVHVYSVALLRYNTGSIGPSLRAALRLGRADRVASAMRKYTGCDDPRYVAGLRIRREAEIKFMQKMLKNLD